MEDCKEILTVLLNCGKIELDTLEELIKKGKKWKALEWDEVRKKIGTDIDINLFLGAVMSSIFEDLIEELPEELQDIALERFNPWLNYSDSQFNNCLDYLDETNERRDAIKCLKEWALELQESK